MSSEWPLVRLGDHVDACLGKMLDAKKNKGAPQPYLGNSNVRWGSFDLADLAEMRFEPHEEDRYGLMPGDLIVCEGGEPGRCAIWTAPVSSMKIQKALHRIRPKATVNNFYLYYWFCQSAKAGLLEPYFTGTTIKHLTGKAIAALEIPLPPVETQAAMVDVLTSLDDRITLLRETNATLEAIAQALFKSWFVDFDPVHAKQQGRAPEGLDEAAIDFFSMTTEPWPRKKVADLVVAGALQIGDGYRAKNVELGFPGIPFVRAGDLDDGRITPTRDHLMSGAENKIKDKSAKAGDTVFTSKGTIGRFAFVGANAGEAVYSPQVCFWRALNSIALTPEYLHFWMRSDFFGSQVNAVRGQAAIMDFVSLTNQRAMWIDLPPISLQIAFSKIVGTLLERISSNRETTDTLASLRDTLLPRLISGQLRLPDAEATTEASA